MHSGPMHTTTRSTLRPFALVVAVCLSVFGASAVAQADEPAAAPSFAAQAISEVIELGPMPAPAFGAATPLLIAQLASSADGEWFDPGWAAVELALGTAGSAYSSWLLSTHIDRDAGFITTYTSSYALAMNLRLVTHGIMSMALYSNGVDPRAASLVPSISVAPLEGGALSSATWAI